MLCEDISRHGLDEMGCGAARAIGPWRKLFAALGRRRKKVLKLAFSVSMLLLSSPLAPFFSPATGQNISLVAHFFCIETSKVSGHLLAVTTVTFLESRNTSEGTFVGCERSQVVRLRNYLRTSVSAGAASRGFISGLCGLEG